MQDFVADYPGTVDPAPGDRTGTPWWVGVSHFLNLFLMAFFGYRQSI